MNIVLIIAAICILLVITIDIISKKHFSDNSSSFNNGSFGDNSFENKGETHFSTKPITISIDSSEKPVYGTSVLQMCIKVLVTAKGDVTFKVSDKFYMQNVLKSVLEKAQMNLSDYMKDIISKEITSAIWDLKYEDIKNNNYKDYIKEKLTKQVHFPCDTKILNYNVDIKIETEDDEQTVKEILAKAEELHKELDKKES